MRSSIRILLVAIVAMTAAGVASAQYVSMDGEYGEANGQVVNIPNNQPIATCVAADDDAGCRFYRKVFPTQTTGAVAFTGMNNPGVGRLATYSTAPGGLTVGASLKVPASFFGQDPLGARLTNQASTAMGRGVGAGPVFQNPVAWISTAYIARMAPVGRGQMLQNPDPSVALPAPLSVTRVMRQLPASGVIPGMEGRELEPTAMTVRNGVTVTQRIHTMDNTGSADTGTLTYTEGPNRFGGTMAVLLDGYSALNIRAFGAFDVFYPAAQQPVLGVQYAGEYDPTTPGGSVPNLSLMTRNGVGWGIPITGGQPSAPLFGPVNTIAGSVCNNVLPTSPPGCNQPLTLPVVTASGAANPNGSWAQLPNPAIPDGMGGFITFTALPPAVSTKYVFPFTTGTVTLAVDAVRGNGATFLETLTAMGYDTVTGGGARQVGLVAGSYTNRQGSTVTSLTIQTVGLNLELTPVPEPASLVALASGVGLLGFAAAYRRRR